VPNKPEKIAVWMPVADKTEELTRMILDNQIARSEAGIARYQRKHNRPRKIRKGE